MGDMVPGKFTGVPMVPGELFLGCWDDDFVRLSPDFALIYSLLLDCFAIGIIFPELGRCHAGEFLKSTIKNRF